MFDMYQRQPETGAFNNAGLAVQAPNWWAPDALPRRNKPHIRRVSDGVRWFWACKGAGITGLDVTPKGAYNAWMRSFRLSPSHFHG